MQVSKQEWKWRDDVKSRHGKIFQERWETEKKDKKKKKNRAEEAAFRDFAMPVLPPRKA